MRAREFILESDDDDHRSQLDKTGFWGRAAAGSILYSRSTGRFCLAHRSPSVQEPNTWGMWGGAMDSGESPQDTAHRELIEETGYTGSAEFHPLWTFEHSSGFCYYNFLALVDREFSPKMDWETQGYEWFDLRDRNSWPSPLHPGVKTLLSRRDVMSRLLSLKPSRRGVSESLHVDVPNEEWLQGKIDYAKRRGRDSFGAPYFNSTTAYNDKDVHVPIEILRRLPGMRGEQQNVRQQGLQAIKKILKDTGRLPLNNSGREYVPYIMVAYNGEAWVNEGNHRIMAAAELYDQGDERFASLPIELKYFDGGERVKSGPLHPSKISQSVSENFVNKVIQESFDQPYPIIWSRGEYGDVDGFTTLADGSRLELLFNLEDKESKQWMFQFYRDDRDDVSGQGDAQRVFATVLSALKIFLRRRRPNMLHFSASREVDSGQKPQSRLNLYTRLMQRYAPTWGYNVEIYDDGGRRIEYVLTPKVKQKTNENFADGRKPGRKGLSRRVGIPKKATLGQLEKIARSSTGERRRMAQWQLNMRRGRARKGK